MAFQEKQLGQRRDNDTNTHSVYSPGASVSAIIKTITLCNTSSSEATVRLFIDDDGTTYDESTAILYDVTVDAKSFLQIDGFYPMNDAGGNLAYQQGTANAITITVFGAEVT
jgi:hypothetical protein